MSKRSARWRALLIAAALLLLPVTALAVSGALTNPAIVWWAVGGGANSTGGGYSLSGSASAPASGQALAGGDYTLAGGYVPEAPQPPVETAVRTFLPIVNVK